MKKLSLLFAALLTATVMNLQAATAGKAPDMRDFLYFVGLNGNDTVRLNKFTLQAAELKNLSATFEYSKDRINWSAYSWADFVVFLNTSQGDPIALNQGDTVFFRAKGTNGKNATMSVNNSAYFQFAFGADDQIAAGGNIMSLYDATCEQDTMTDYGFSNLFEGANQLLNAPKVPAKTLKTSCYRCMFRNCSSLVDAPALPATTLQEQCYYQMFKSCTSLTQAPELKATTLADGCYNAMFSNCTSLTQAPELPATTLPQSCYSAMFQGCTSLTQAPELKATTLGDKCYMNMFQGCTSLEVNSFSVSCDGAELEVPTVSGTAPANWNRRMFTGCKGDAALTAETGIQLGGHYCIQKYVEPDMHDFLHFVSLKDNGTVQLNKNGMFYNNLAAKIQYSKDRKAWTDYSWNAKEGTAIALAEGDTVFFRAGGSGLNTAFSTSVNSYFRFVFGDNDSIAAGGNIMSLYDATCEQLSMTSYGFYKLFYSCDALVSAPKMPATTLDTYCYQSMFQGCAGLQSVPETLPATTLASCCYHSMFSKCTSLTSAPALPATTLTSGCYTNMFNGCSALAQAPELKATTLTASCYYAMFKQCTSLAEIPVLEAETLATFCYYQMFSGCSQFEVSALSGTCDGVGLTLPVPTELTDTCIQGMFGGCKGAYANNIQLGGHYCIKEYKGPVCQIGTKEYESIAAAVAEVQAGETIQVLKDIQLDAVIDVTSSTPACTLDLNGHILDGSALDNQSLLYNASTLYIIDSNPTATHEAPFDTIQGAIMTGGKGWKSSNYSYGGAIYNYNYGTLHVKDVAFVNNTADYGGGVYSYQTASTFKNCRFYGNIGTQYGAALYINSKTCSIDSCIFQENASYYGIVYGYQATINVNGSTFVKDSASLGGAAYFYKATSTFKNCRFNGNKGTQYGGAIFVYGNTCSIDSCVFQENASDCGIIYGNNQAIVNVNGSEFINNTAPYGGAAYFYQATSVFKNCSFKENTAEDDGNDNGTGIVYWYNAQGSMDSCVVEDNNAKYGILFAKQASSLTIAHTTITGNSVIDYPGAVGLFTGSSLTMNDGTVITNNTSGADYQSAGVYIWAQSGYDNSITLSGKVIIKDNTTNGEPANLCLSGDPACDTITLNGLSEGSEIHVCTMIDDVVTPATFAANATEADMQYLKSDNGYAFVLKEGMIASKQAYGRKVTSGNFGTICLTKQFIATEGVEGLYVPYMVKDDSLYCEEMPLDSVKAGYAYIFKSNADSVTFALDGNATMAATEANYMKGWLANDYTLVASDVQAGGTFYGYYFLADNEITKPLAESQILKNRAMIQLPGSAPSAPARGRLVAFGLNGTTGMVDVNANVNANANCKVMVNGQFVIIRDGKKFNAQGAQL